jgi:hypothetical protein
MQLAYLNSMEAELLGALSHQEASFAVVGGHAVLAYSSPDRPDGSTRTLGDLDILIDPAIENLRRVSRALAHLRIGLSVEELAAAYTNKQLPNLTGGYQAQLFPSIAGVETAEVLQSSRTAQSSVGPLPIISKQHLMTAKRAAGRPKDLDDLRVLELLESEPNSRLDTSRRLWTQY